MNKKEQIFNLFSNNLTSLFPVYTDVYACPLCKVLFTKDSIKSGQLTLEHIIPDALDGKLYVLLCKDCNSLCGSELDIHLVNKIRSLNIIDENHKKPIKVTMNIGDIYARGSLSVSSDKSIQITVNSKLTNPEHENEFYELFKYKNATIELNGNFNYIHDRVLIALLKIGYLIFFHYFGYIALHNSYDIIRNQILNPNVDIFKPLILNVGQHITETFKLGYIKKYNSTFFTIIINQNYINENIAIILPDPFNFDYNSYIKLHNEYQQNTIKLNFTEIPYNKYKI